MTAKTRWAWLGALSTRPAPPEQAAHIPGQTGVAGVDPAAAEEFLVQFHAENPHHGPAAERIAVVMEQIARFGTYWHTDEELIFGARVAWRNSSRCIGRLYWRSLRVRDRRHINQARQVAAESVVHLREATNDGRIRPTITVFAPDTPLSRGPRIHNEQLIRYAGYRRADGTVLGDPRQLELTDTARRLGWPGGAGTAFDVLPLVIENPHGSLELFEVPAEAVLEVPLSHPRHPWFATLGLRWHAVPAIANMPLEIGGIRYPAAPFNGWYMGTEIGARNLADTDRYDLLPVIAARMDLDTTEERTLWRDQALVELNIAVLHSFTAAEVTITDHHTESRRFLKHLAREESAGRCVPADWSWIVPPISGSATPVFHRYYDQVDLRPAYLHPAATTGAPVAPDPLDLVCRLPGGLGEGAERN